MSIYAVGDLQGCHAAFSALLDKLQFDPQQDQLWLCGDLVNRGPDSLATLRLVRSLGDAAISVLGNHDLHLLAIAQGLATTRDKSLRQLLDAPDAAELLGWLRQRPLLYHHAGLKHTLVHAGIYPLWDLPQAQARAAELEQVLRGPDYFDFFEHMYGDEPSAWSNDLQGWPRLRFICNAFTRMRFCTTDGRLELHAKGSPDKPPADCYPWFTLPQRRAIDSTILFGHWSTLGVYRQHRVQALDTGCVWGGQLTACRLDAAESGRYVQIECKNLRAAAKSK